MKYCIATALILVLALGLSLIDMKLEPARAPAIINATLNVVAVAILLGAVVVLFLAVRDMITGRVH